MARRHLDAYYTPTHLTEMLLREMPELRDMTVCDPCCGDGAILKCFGVPGDLLGFDIDPTVGAVVRDARTGRYPTAEAFVTNPPTRVYVCPRTSFTGDGRTDSVTCAWMIWEPGHGDGQVIKILPRSALSAALRPVRSGPPTER